MNQMSPEMGDSPIKNWKGTSRDWGMRKSYSSNPDVFTDCEKSKVPLLLLPAGMRRNLRHKRENTVRPHKPEYETVLSLGGLCMNQDADSIFYLNELLNRGRHGFHFSRSCGGICHGVL